MKKLMSAVMAVVICGAAMLASGCGPGADETVKGYLDAQQAYDSEKAVAVLCEEDQAEARETMKSKLEKDKAAGNKLVSYEIISVESDSDEAIVKVNVTRTRNGKEKVREEMYYLKKEDGGWRVDKGMDDLLNTDYEAELEESWNTESEVSEE
ncbi:MAG: hypothetical protein ICCCNLDF_01958 [Planctomycetes bacterium]|nr:hypothetical protein [Planctomycetota bacterium]